MREAEVRSPTLDRQCSHPTSCHGHAIDFVGLGWPLTFRLRFLKSLEIGPMRFMPTDSDRQKIEAREWLGPIRELDIPLEFGNTSDLYVYWSTEAIP